MLMRALLLYINIRVQSRVKLRRTISNAVGHLHRSGQLEICSCQTCSLTAHFPTSHSLPGSPGTKVNRIALTIVQFKTVALFQFHNQQ